MRKTTTTPDALRRAIRGGLRNAKLEADGKPADNDTPALGGITKIGTVAKRLGGCSHKTIRNYVELGLLEGFKLPGGKKIIGIYSPSVDAFISGALMFTRAAHKAEKSARAG